MTVTKSNGFRAPYKSSTFRDIANQQTGRNGVLSIDGEVVQSGSSVIIPAFSVIQQGLIYHKSTPTTIAAATMPPPYLLTVSAPSPSMTDDLQFRYSKGPTDTTDMQVPLASFDGAEWRPIPLVSIDGVIEDRLTENVETGRVGPYTGLKTSVVGTDYVTSPGTLIDKFGERQQFGENIAFPMVEGDPDFKRVDRVYYRRSIDSKLRVGARRFGLGGTYAAAPSVVHQNNFTSTATITHQKVVVSSDNKAHILSAASGAIFYTQVSSDRQTVITTTTVLAGLTLTSDKFDAVIDNNNDIHLIYCDTALFHQKIAMGGTLIGSAARVSDLSAQASAVKCVIDPAGTRIHIVYRAVDGLLGQIYYSNWNISASGVDVVGRKLTEKSGSVSSMDNPDIAISNDFVLYIAWQNTTAGTILYQRFFSDSVDTPIDTNPIVVSASTARIGFGTLVNVAKNPRIHISDNDVLFISFLQQWTAGTWGVTVWDSHNLGEQRQLLSPTENFEDFDVFVEPIFNDVALLLKQADRVDIVKLNDIGIDFDLNFTNDPSEGVAFVRDNLGSFFVSWCDEVLGGFFTKATSQSYARAYDRSELSSDVLLCRMVQPDEIVLNWIFEDRPGSFYDFLTAYGQSIVIDWEVTAPGTLALGPGLKVLDMFTDTSYDIASGNYPMTEGDALFMILDGETLNVTPQVLPLAVVPWDSSAVVFGTIKGSQFVPALLGVAGMTQLDSGESIIFGEDLPQSIRARLGIIDETSFQAYTSLITISNSNTYPTAISNVDIVAGQNSHIKLLDYEGTWEESAPDTLRLLSSCYIQVPGLPKERNEIQSQDIVLPNVGDIAYVYRMVGPTPLDGLNRTGVAPEVLNVGVAVASSFIPTRDSYILARRTATGVEVGGLAVTYSDRLIVGQGNSIVTDGDTLETAIKKLDVRSDVVKRVRAITRTISALPTGADCTIDSVVLNDGDKVLFANPTLNGIYQISGVGASISWLQLYEFAGSMAPSSEALVMVFDGSTINRTLWSYDPIKSWYRVTLMDDCVSVRAADFTTTTLPTGTDPVVVDGVTVLDGEMVLFGNAALNRVYRVFGVGVDVQFETMNIFVGEEAPSDGSRVLAEDGTASDMVWEYDAELSAWHHITLTYQNKQYLGLTSPDKSGGEFQDQLTPGQVNNIVHEGDSIEKAIKRLDVRPDVLKKVRAVDLGLTDLPTGATCYIDGVLLVDGDKVLFTSDVLDGIYQVSGVGVDIQWVKLYEFNGSQTANSTSTVFVAEGSSTNKTIWLYDPTDITTKWRKLVDPDFGNSFYNIIAQHTEEINDLQNALAAILANKPKVETFYAGVGGQTIFNLTQFSVSPLNTILDIYVYWNGRWQQLSELGDFTDGAFRKNSATQIELAETIPEGEEISVFRWDPASILTNTAKVQSFTAVAGGQSVFNLDALIFTVEADNAIIDCEYFINGRWQHQSILGDFSDGGVRKNSTVQIELARPLAEGQSFTVLRRVPVGAANPVPGPSTDLSNVSTNIGFTTPKTVGTFAGPADSMILADKVTADIWRIEVSNGVLQVVKLN